MSRKSLWERIVEWTIAVGERLLAPVERFIGRRSLVGDATFFPLERFPWVTHVEENWTVIREELERVLDDHAALPNFQDISKDQIEITDDDRWKTFFLYGFGFKAKLGVEMCPRTAALMEQIPGMKTAMFSILSPRKHILDHRGPYKGVLRYHLGLIVPREAENCRIRVGEDIRHWEEGKSMIFDDTFNHEVWNDTDETRVVLFVDVLRPLPFPESAINRLIVAAIALLAVRARRQAKPGGVGKALPRAQARAEPSPRRNPSAERPLASRGPQRVPDRLPFHIDELAVQRSHHFFRGMGREPVLNAGQRYPRACLQPHDGLRPGIRAGQLETLHLLPAKDIRLEDIANDDPPRVRPHTADGVADGGNQESDRADRRQRRRHRRGSPPFERTPELRQEVERDGREHKPHDEIGNRAAVDDRLLRDAVGAEIGHVG